MNTASCPFKFVIGEDVPPSPQSGLWTHFVSAIKRFASFSGRATRKEYWSFVLFIVIFNLIISSSLDAIQKGIIESVILEQIKAGNMEFLAAARDGNANVFDFGFSCGDLAKLAASDFACSLDDNLRRLGAHSELCKPKKL